jgi:ATP-dependent Clp protease ATP-binding subunit ClpX
LAAVGIPRPNVRMPASQTAIAILEFGKLLSEEERRYHKDRNPDKVRLAEERLVERLHGERSASLKSIFNFGTAKTIDRVTLRVLSHVAYASLCTNRLGISVSDVVAAVGGEPASILETRQTVSKLLIAKQLLLRSGHILELGEPLMTYLAGGKHAPPLAVSEWDLQRLWYKSDQETKKRKAKEVNLDNLPTAKQLAERITRDVVGLDEQVRMLSCRLALHLRRAAMIRADRNPGTPCECILILGVSGCGKSWMAEHLGKIAGLPFSSMSSGDITASGYVGMDLSDCLRPLLTETNGDVVKAQSGIVFLDEWDKRAATTTHWSDIGGLCVQQEVLRLMEGATVQVGGRRGGFDLPGVLFDTHATMWLFAGAYIGLDKMIQKGKGQSIGFHDMQSGTSRTSALYEGLERFGMLPEFLNRLTGVVVFPEPTPTQVTAIVTRSIIPSFNRALAALGASIEVSEEGIRLVADAAVRSKTYARGVKSVMSSLIEELVFEARQGTVRLGCRGPAGHRGGGAGGGPDMLTMLGSAVGADAEPAGRGRKWQAVCCSWGYESQWMSTTALHPCCR